MRWTRRLADQRFLVLLWKFIKAGCVDRDLFRAASEGVPQGGVISPLLSSVYLTEVDRMQERAKDATRNGKYAYVEYVGFADDLVVLIDAPAPCVVVGGSEQATSGRVCQTAGRSQ